MFYLKLYNGHYSPNQGVDDFGFAGSAIGPLKKIHGTDTHLMLTFAEVADAVKFGIDAKFPVIKFYKGTLIHRMPGDDDFTFYGDWCAEWLANHDD
ncbi:hypothetical protein [Thiothrix lacustris]|uniref:hypothetical protein n=1 Tax=Thiothrix lacustris TaxID=525917 RepID=UPI0027E4D7C0|nr:hypothetical protein [Thiothrix lacustris]WMP17297.1 hypothetical protein RCS87_18210 [Thiothrix lacustris]